jgi:hypothetical protein
MKAKDERDKMKQESIALQLKLFSVINKNVAPKFPSEPELSTGQVDPGVGSRFFHL